MSKTRLRERAAMGLRVSWFQRTSGTLRAFVLLQPQQILKQVVLSVDQHRIAGAKATAVAQDPRRRLIIVSDGSQIPVDQRLHDAFPYFPVTLGACPISFNNGHPS